MYFKKLTKQELEKSSLYDYLKKIIENLDLNLKEQLRLFHTHSEEFAKRIFEEDILPLIREKEVITGILRNRDISKDFRNIKLKEHTWKKASDRDIKIIENKMKRGKNE